MRIDTRGSVRRSRELLLVQVKGSGLKGFEPLTYRFPSTRPAGRVDKSRSLYLAKLQAQRATKRARFLKGSLR